MIVTQQQRQSDCLSFACLNLEGIYFLEALDNQGNLYSCSSVFGCVEEAWREASDLKPGDLPFWWRRTGTAQKTDCLYYVTAIWDGIRRIRFREASLKNAQLWKTWCDRNEPNSQSEILIVDFSA